MPGDSYAVKRKSVPREYFPQLPGRENCEMVPGAVLKDDLGLESLDFVDIAVIVKKEFGITMKGKEVRSIKTMGNLYDFIYNYIQKK